MSIMKPDFDIPVTSRQKSSNTSILLGTIASSAAILLGLISLLGWCTNILVLASFIPSTKPTAPSAAIIIVLLGTILFGQIRQAWGENTRKALHVLALLISFISLCEIVLDIANENRSLDWWVLQHFPSLSTPFARISPVAAVLALFIGSMTALLLSAMRLSQPKRFLRDLPGLIGTLAMFISGTFLLGYLYGAPFLYHSNSIPIAAPASLAFLLLSIGVIVASGSGSAPLSWFVGPKTKAHLMQVFIPLTIAATLGTNLLQTILSRTFHISNALVMSLSSVFLAILVAWIVSLVSRRLGKSIDEAESAIHASTERWKVTVHSIGDAVIATDANKNITVMNVVAETLTGWTEAEAIGHPISEVFYIINETTREICDDPVEKVLRLGIVVGLANHTVLIARDGKEYCISDSGAPIRDDSGAITGVILVFRDVTEERRAQDALNASNDRFRLAILNAPIPIMLHAEDGEVIQISSAWTHLTGYTMNDIPTIKEWVIRAHREASEQVMERIDELFNLDVSRNGIQYEIATSNGDQRIWEFNSGSLGRLPDGRKLVISMAVDVTERRKAEVRQAFALKILHSLNAPSADPNLMEHLIRSLHNYTQCDAIALRLQDGKDYPICVSRGFSDKFIDDERSLCEHDVDGQILLDGNRKPILKCMCANVILGHTDPAQPFFSEGGSFWTNSTSKLMADTSNTEWTKDFPCKCNKVGYESLALIPLRSGSKTLGLIQFADRLPNHFTPELIQFFEEVGASIGIALARNRSESTLRETEEHLRQAAKMESIGRLAGGVAHDFNNILTGISGLTEFSIHNTSPESPVHQDLSEVLSLTNRAANLTRQLLAFSRHQTIEAKPVDLNALVSNLLKMLNRLIGENISLVFCPSPDTGTVFADPGLLEQLFMNLAVNSRDAMPNGGQLAIEICNTVLDDTFTQTHPGLRPGEHVMLNISDTGCGMDQETVQHIFEPFFTTKEVGKGTGLGLATVYGIVKQHDGSISVSSELGRGTTFKVYIPRHRSDMYQETIPGHRNEIPRGDETLLLVEDEMSVRDVTQRMLQQHGYTVIATSSASKAMAMFAKHKSEIDLLISDVIMPGKSGAELYRELSEESPNMRALFISGYSGDTLVNIMDIAPGIRCLQKPFSREDLLRTVREIMDQK